jgi:hypothetical protein
VSDYGGGGGGDGDNAYFFKASSYMHIRAFQKQTLFRLPQFFVYSKLQKKMVEGAQWAIATRPASSRSAYQRM